MTALIVTVILERVLRGVTQLYTELILLAVVLSIGSVLIYLASEAGRYAVSIEPRPRLDAYRVGDTVIIANWGDVLYLVRIYCLDSEAYEDVEVAPGTYLYNTTCATVIITCRGYTIEPIRIV